jgi:hypothetical protein
MPTKHPMEKILKTAGDFVIAQKGDWDHDAWEGLLASVSGLGLDVEDDFKRNLGNVLEATKYFYYNLPAETPKKKAPAKAKAKAKKA